MGGLFLANLSKVMVSFYSKLLITHKLMMSWHNVINFFHIFSTMNWIFDISVGLKIVLSFF